MKNIFTAIYQLFEKHKIIVFFLFFGLILSFAYLANKLKFDSDLNSMMPAEKGRESSEIFTKNKSLEKIIVSVSLKDSTNIDPDLLTSYADLFSSTLLEIDQQHIISKIETKQDEDQMLSILQTVQDNLPFLLNQEDYDKIERQLNHDSIRTKLENSLHQLSTPNGLALKSFIQKDPLGMSFIALNKLKDLQQDEQTELYDGYVMTKDQRYLTFFIHSTYPASDTKHNEGLEALLSATQQKLSTHSEFKEVESIYFGGQLVASGNATQMSKDTKLTLTITLVLLLILFISFFKNFLAPFQIMIPVIFGGLFGMAVMYLIKGKVSLMSMGASSVILGIAVNYSLHFMSHLRHAKSKEETIQELCEPMTIGSFTTIFAFLSLMFVHTPVLQELGLFTAMNLIGSSLCTLIFLPHFVKKSNHEHTNSSNWIEKLSGFNLGKSKWVVLGIIVLTVVLSFFMNDVKFNEDLMTMNFMQPKLASYQKEINKRNAESLNSIFCVSEGKDIDEAINSQLDILPQLNELKSNQSIRKYSSPAQFILSKEAQKQKIIDWNTFWTKEKKENLLALIQDESTNLGFQSQAFSAFGQILNKTYLSTDSLYQQSFTHLFKDLIITNEKGVKVLAILKTSQDKRKELFSKFQGNNQTYIIDKQSLSTKFVNFIKEDFFKILALTSLIVFLTILISYGRIEIALISFIPMVITWICILGLMAVLGIEFNIINIIISTLIFGLGDDYSIFITDGLIEKYKYGKTKINSIKTSIFLSAITTIIGLGILIFAKHPALRSIAMVSVIGIVSILLISQTLQPLLFNFFIQHRTNKKFHPFTAWSFIKTIFAFTYYVLGCLMVTLIGFILTKCLPFNRDKMKYLYHVVICKMMWSLLYIMANARKTFANKAEAHFEKPAVIIANHSSFLDLLRIISLHPKILLMTNKWVWRSPVFGALVRMADYYPVEEGAEESIDKLKYWVDRGYSIAVFPEGTRSYDGVTKRFHKGAFYIAEKLQLDILPTLFHGIHYTMQKGDFLLKNGEINVKFLPRISPSNTEFGSTYTEKAKQIGKYFRQQLHAYAQERETVHYFREQLIKNYIYKGPILEWYCRIKTKLENNYETIEKKVPKSGNILDIGCGYGFLAYMLSFMSNQRQITGLDYDEEKIEVANHNVSKSDKLHFVADDAIHFPTNTTYDCILIMDVLHYLVPEKQHELLSKCHQYLNPGGSLIIRDGWQEYQQKHKGTLLSEFFSTKVFNFNKTDNALHFISGEMLQKFASDHSMQFELIDQTKFTSNVISILHKSKS